MQKQALLCCVLVFGGCIALQNEVAPGRCTSSADCVEPSPECAFIPGELSGVCVSEAANPLNFAVDISPLSDNKDVLRHQQIFGANDFAQNSLPEIFLGNFTLEQAVTVSGVVIALGATTTPLVHIRAISQEVPLIKGTKPEIFEADSDEKGQFNLKVRPGAYDVTATSASDPSLPPLILKNVSLPLKNNGALDISMNANTKVRGILTADGAPLENVRVLARAEDDILGLRSTIATTAADGSFEIAITPNESKLVFRFEPIAGGPSEFIPTSEELVLLNNLPLNSGALDLGLRDLGPVTAALQFDGHVSGPGANLDEVADADISTVLTFSRVEPNGSTRSFSRLAIVDEFGNYSVELLPGVYDIAVQTPAASELAATKLSGVSFICDAEPCAAVDIALARRHKIFGEILGAPQQDVQQGFTVEARPAGQPDAGPVKSVFSDALRNTFEIFLDPGVYDLTFVPPSSSGIAPGFLFSVGVTPDSDVGIDLTIPPASLLVGQLAANEQMGVLDPPLAIVRVFAVSSDGSFYLLNTAASEIDGNFFLVVPNPPPSDAQLFEPLLP